jgi:hypothetical protein
MDGQRKEMAKTRYISGQTEHMHMVRHYYLVVSHKIYGGTFTCKALPPSRHPTGSILKAVVVKPHLQNLQKQ